MRSPLLRPIISFVLRESFNKITASCHFSIIDPKAILSIFIKKTFFKIADIPKKRTGMSGVQDHADMTSAVSEIPLV
jgi:hypothetical protein